jgi:hypothetical protein
MTDPAMVEILQAIATTLGKLVTKSTLGQLVRWKLQRLYDAYEPFFPATFFAGGFAFDIATLGRIDHWVTLIQQGLFLLVIGSLLTYEAHFNVRGLPYPDWFERHRGYYESLMHFLFGGLLSAYTIFYFKSSSLMTSATFMLLLIALLVVNEHSVFRRQGLPVKLLLFSLCIASFFSYLVPIFWGSIGVATFTVSICLSLLTTSLFLKAITQNVHLSLRTARHLLAPALSVQMLFSGLYYLGALPPVPLSLPYIGIFHDVERRGDTFLLYHENPFWRFWHNGDQEFVARENDRIYGYARIFPPTNFADEVFIRWLYKASSGKWLTSDLIRMSITGGRQEGFRGYTYKENYDTGECQMRVETADGRELGRIYFEVREDRRVGERSFRTIES